MDSKEFQALRDQWYALLKERGFVDIENHSNGLLVRNSSYFGLVYDELTFETRSEYYTLVEYTADEPIFKNDDERAVWILHGKGATVREIEAQTGISKSRANYIIKKLRAVVFEGKS